MTAAGRCEIQKCIGAGAFGRIGKAWNKRLKGIGCNALAAELVALKKLPETAFLKESHSQVLQQMLMDLDKAFGAFFDKG